MSVIPSFDAIRGMVSEAKLNPYTVTSLLFAWAFIHAIWGYGYVSVLPQVNENSMQIAAVATQINAVKDDIGQVKGEVRGLNSSVSSLTALLLGKELREAKLKQCLATTRSEKLSHQATIDQMRREFEKRTGDTAPTPPACSDILP